MKHLLVVDDEAEIRELLHDALSSEDVRVTAVSSTVEAMQVLQTDPPDLVITDLQLVDSDGFETIEQVKTLNPKLPIIMLTGVLMNPAEIPPAMARMIAAYLPKTTSLEEIVKTVRQCLS